MRNWGKYLTWLCANKLSLNIKKSNFVLFHARQKLVVHSFSLKINNEDLKCDCEACAKYLGIPT